jgi:hypothetical protein
MTLIVVEVKMMMAVVGQHSEQQKRLNGVWERDDEVSFRMLNLLFSVNVCDC